jgi:hypothetical protein
MYILKLPRGRHIFKDVSNTERWVEKTIWFLLYMQSDIYLTSCMVLTLLVPVTLQISNIKYTFPNSKKKLTFTLYLRSVFETSLKMWRPRGNFNIYIRNIYHKILTIKIFSITSRANYKFNNRHLSDFTE